MAHTRLQMYVRFFGAICSINSYGGTTGLSSVKNFILIVNNIVCFTGSISRETIGSHDVRGDLGAGLQQRSERRLRGRGTGGSREAQQTTDEAAGLLIPIIP